MAKFTLLNGRGAPSYYDTVEAVIAAGKSQIYAAGKVWKRAEERLRQGDPVTISYGFSAIQIWPE